MERKTKSKKSSNEQNPGWKALTGVLTTKKTSQNVHTHNKSSSIQSLSTAEESQLLPLLSPQTFTGTGKAASSGTGGAAFLELPVKDGIPLLLTFCLLPALSCKASPCFPSLAALGGHQAVSMGGNLKAGSLLHRFKGSSTTAFSNSLLPKSKAPMT